MFCVTAELIADIATPSTVLTVWFTSLVIACRPARTSAGRWPVGHLGIVAPLDRLGQRRIAGRDRSQRILSAGLDGLGARSE